MKKTSTESFPDGKFQAHGRVSLEIIDKNLIVYHSKGPFNIELLTALAQVEEELLKTIKNNAGSWCEIVVFEESCMALDDVMLGFGDYLKELQTKRLTPLATAYVISKEIEGGSIMKDKYKKCHLDAGIEFSLFETESAAISWINKCLSLIHI